jgi:UDP-N-acetylmuramoyl-tripeptide--D-alanyl-D-alanine ligase
MKFDLSFMNTIIPPNTIISAAIPANFAFSVDSRTVEPGDIFVALQGNVQDGHDFVLDALHNGAAGCIIKHTHRKIVEQLSQEERAKLFIAVVPEPYETLYALAQAWRAQLVCPIVAITGSVGKTSTKELVAHIMREAKKRSFVSYANQNTLIGIILNILKVRAEHECAIFEVGTGRRGDIRAIATLLQPTIAAITNIGHQHMDELGSLQEIAYEKRSLFSTLTERNIGIINGDQALLSTVSYSHPVLKVGSKTINQIQARKIRVDGELIHFILKIYQNRYPVTLKQVHKGMVFNTLTATAIAHLLGVDDVTIVCAIQKPITVPGRFEQCVMRNNHGLIINATYNANPESVKVELLALEHIKTTAKKIVILGDMRGLGQDAPFWHRQIGRFLRKINSLQKLILVGTDVAWVKKTAPLGLAVELVPDSQSAIIALQAQLDTEVLVLVKGSRSLHLEQVVNAFVHHEQAMERSRLWHQ